ncbi:MAG: Gfo/Idh/MocA family oxidoreductase [Anaerolineae bacterium]|nr:Gfo/Idh/MocA family oxidoreductase [Anaerolineae bacterium]
MPDEAGSRTETPEGAQVPEDDYAGARSETLASLEAPDLRYQPTDPKSYRPAIGLIAAGGITGHHLPAYRAAGYNVVAICDLIMERAVDRRDTFYPEAEVTTDYRDVLARDDVEVVDIATHPPERVALIEAALLAGKHVLSQKPFVLDLTTGERLCELAERQGVKLAVNQNGRWAPHVAYMRQAVAAGLLGDLTSADLAVHWDHSWVKGTPFDEIYDLVLYDFAIHWFDMLTCYFGDRRPERVYAAIGYAAGQTPKPPLLAHVLVDYPTAQATMNFNAFTQFGPYDRTTLIGTKGTAQSTGTGLQEQTLEIFTQEGVMRPELQGQWFDDGFHGTMGELLCAIEENRTPYHNAADNLRSLELAFAAIASSHDGQPKRVGEVRRLPGI